MVDANELITCIKKDDVKTFLTFERENKLQTVRLGRFPVLSVVYLFGAKKIAAQIETRYVKVNSWTEEIEPFPLWRDKPFGFTATKLSLPLKCFFF